jgi:diguanylate cyclase
VGTPSNTDTQPSAPSGEDFARTMAHGERALSLLKQLRSPAIPRNYELLFAFTTSTNKDLCQALRTALETDSCLTEEAAERIYQTYLTKANISEQVDEVGSQVSHEMSEIMSVIEAASERTGDYGESLKGMNAKLGGIESPQQLKTVLAELFETTNDMAEYNQILKKRLAESKSQIDELQMNLELTRVESFTDELTGLTNRKRFDQAMELELSEAEDSGDPLCLMMLDIDHFKSFNDTHGHQTGDQVLRLVAHTLKTNVKGRDCAARYGGEEFAIILPKTKLAAAIIVANQVRIAVKTKELVKKSTNESLGHVTMSIGVASYKIGESIPELIERSDVCLYAAKEAGRDNVKSETELSKPEAQVSAA